MAKASDDDFMRTIVDLPDPDRDGTALEQERSLREEWNR